jgi:hypothetical protein
MHKITLGDKVISINDCFNSCAICQYRDKYRPWCNAFNTELNISSIFVMRSKECIENSYATLVKAKKRTLMGRVIFNRK